MNPTTEIQKIRTRIAEIKAKRDAVTSQKRSRKEANTLVEQQITNWTAEADATNKTNAARAANGSPVEFLTVHGTAMTPQGPIPVSIDLGPLAVLLLGAPAVRKAITQTLEAIPEGLTASARTRALQACKIDLHAAQTEEERLIRQAEQTGEAVAYRPDADPARAISFIDPA